jgi:hypothetical protein
MKYLIIQSLHAVLCVCVRVRVFFGRYKGNDGTIQK